MPTEKKNGFNIGHIGGTPFCWSVNPFTHSRRPTIVRIFGPEIDQNRPVDHRMFSGKALNHWPKHIFPEHSCQQHQSKLDEVVQRFGIAGHKVKLLSQTVWVSQWIWSGLYVRNMFHAHISAAFQHV